MVASAQSQSVLPLKLQYSDPQNSVVSVEKFRAFKANKGHRRPSSKITDWISTNRTDDQRQFEARKANTDVVVYMALHSVGMMRVGSGTAQLTVDHRVLVNTQLVSAALRRLTKLAALEPNWDDEGAKPPAALAIARASLLLELVNEFLTGFGIGIHPPDTSAPLPNGGIQLEWWSTTTDIESFIEPDGAVHCLFVDKFPSGEETHLESGKIGISAAAEAIASRLRSA